MLNLLSLQEEATADYWKTPVGIAERISMIGEDFTFRVYNNALAVYGSDTYSSLQWMGYGQIESPSQADIRTCKFCRSKIGHIYKTGGQYIPPLPAHNRCRCSWKLIPRGE